MKNRAELKNTVELEETLQEIPESGRTTKVSGQFWIWAGANVAPTNWVLGALGIQLGLNIWQTIAVMVIGNAIGMAAFGLFVLLGQRTGTTGIVMSRAVFGRVANYFPSVIHTLVPLIWCALNTWIVLSLIMSLLGRLGLVNPNEANVGLQIAVAAGIMIIQVVIAWIGYKAIAPFERWTVPITIAILIVMSIMAWFFLNPDWGYVGIKGHALTGAPLWSALSGLMTASGIGWSITWFIYGADYSRFVSRSVSRRKLYFTSVIGNLFPVIWLGFFGATLATKSTTIDPGALVVGTFGLMAIPVLFLVIHGPIATNSLNIYTYSVATQALDAKISRRLLSVLAGVIAMAITVFFVYQSNFANTIASVLDGIVAWVATWGAIMLVHYYWVMRGRRLPVAALFDPVGTKRLPAVNWAALVAFVCGIIMTWVFMYGLVPALQGPAATAMGGVDASWLVGAIVSGGLYALLAPIALRRFLLAWDADAPEMKEPLVRSEAGPVTAQS
ncbi:MAG: cytosine permease [Microbacteriaceae bacterium]|nr:MAG: cytosine permease [Microbacteriaceae bacterium]